MFLFFVKCGEHKHDVGKKQLRGEERQIVAQQVILNSNGSTHDYVNNMITDYYMAGEAIPDYASAQKLKNWFRQAVSEYMNTEMVSTCWITNLNYVSEATRVMLDTCKLKGYVQQCDIQPEFCLTLHCQKQLEFIKLIEPQKRILFVDSSGGLCKITKQMNADYQRIQNYVFLLKDISKLNEPGAVINETITSQHTTRRLLDMFNLLKSNFKFVFDTSLLFRFVVCDLCWPTIHARLEAMNLETIFEYANRIFKYSSDKEVDSTQQKGFLASCISHSSHRYARGLKRYVKFYDKEHKLFSACCFSFSEYNGFRNN